MLVMSSRRLAWYRERDRERCTGMVMVPGAAVAACWEMEILEGDLGDVGDVGAEQISAKWIGLLFREERRREARR